MLTPECFFKAVYLAPSADEFQALTTPEFSVVDPIAAPGLVLQGDAVIEYFAAFRQFFHDFEVEILHDIDFGDTRLSRQRITATHLGGWSGQKKRGQRVSWESASVWRMTDGRFATLDTVWDAFSLAQKLDFKVEVPLGLSDSLPHVFSNVAPADMHRSIRQPAKKRVRLIQEMSDVLLAKGQKERVFEFFNPNIRLIDTATGSGSLSGYEVSQSVVDYVQAMIQNYHLRFLHFYALGDYVGARLRIRGINKGGFLGVPVKGRNFDIACINLYRFEGERISDIWMHWDAFSLVSELGALLVPNQ